VTRAMRRGMRLATTIACAAATVSDAAIYKCTESSGSVSYQQQPCPADAQSTASGKGAAPALVPASQLAVGMRADAIKQLRGPPDHVFRTEGQGPDAVEEWIYSNAQRGNQAVAITLQRGVVVRWKPLGADAAAPRP
jgi:Domain of unknown function (DUF4124)